MIRLCNPCDCIVAKLKASFEEALSSQRRGVVKGWFAGVEHPAKNKINSNPSTFFIIYPVSLLW